MKKTIKVESIIRYAQAEVELYNKYMSMGKYELAKMTQYRIDTMQSVIMVLAVGNSKDFHDKWNEIHKEIWGE